VFLGVGVVLFAEDRKARRLPPAVPTQTGVLRAYVEVLRDRWVRTVMLTVFLEGSLFYGAFAYGGAYLKDRFDLSYLIIGALLAGFGLGGVIYSLLVRWLLARLGEKGFVLAGGLILFVCFLALPLLPLWLATVPIYIASGFGFYMFHNTLQTKATEMAPQARGTRSRFSRSACSWARLAASRHADCSSALSATSGHSCLPVSACSRSASGLPAA
jgi:predicted MFS family arabinose efflux permease